MRYSIFTPAILFSFSVGIGLAVMPFGLAAAVSLSLISHFIFPALLSAIVVVMVAFFFAPRYILYWLVFLVGVLWGLHSAVNTTASLLPVALDDQVFMVTGKITGLPRAINSFDRQGQQFDVHLDSYHCQNVTITCDGLQLKNLQLRWYGAQSVHSEELWQFAVQLRRPRGLASPAARDYSVWMIQQGISATGKVINGRRLAAAHGIFAWREDLSKNIQQQLQGFSQAGILEALINGNGAAIETSQWQIFADTNTTHLFVISGLHLSLMGGLCWWLLRRLLNRVGNVIGFYSPFYSTVFAAILAWLFATIYAFIAGWTIPVQRALGVFTLVLLMIVWRRSVQPLQVFGLLLAISLAADPLSLFSLSFWLSWTAAAVLIMALVGRKNHHILQSWWHSQWAVTVGLAPVLIFSLGQVSLLGFFANALAIPLVNLIVVPFDFLALCLYPLWFDAAYSIWFGLNYLLQSLLDFLQWMVTVGDAFIWHPTTAIVPLGFLIVAAVMVLLPKVVPLRRLFLVGFLPIIFWPEPTLPDDQLQMTVFDVGQGLAVLVQVADKVLLYDAGPKLGETNDAGRAIILPYLYRQGIRHLDYLVVSHADMDHAGGVMSILKKITPQQIFLGEPLPSIKGDSCQQYQSWQWQHFVFEFINLDQSQVNSENGFFTVAGNNRSCVLRIYRDDKKLSPALVLLTGDIERPVEYYLLRQQRDRLAADVLLMPHHGSHTSSSTAFVKAVNSHTAIASAGYRHRFGHPHRDVVRRYQQQGSDILNTAETGTIRLSWQQTKDNPKADVNNNWHIEALYRQHMGYFWQ